MDIEAYKFLKHLFMFLQGYSNHLFVRAPLIIFCVFLLYKICFYFVIQSFKDELEIKKNWAELKLKMSNEVNAKLIALAKEKKNEMMYQRWKKKGSGKRKRNQKKSLTPAPKPTPALLPAPAPTPETFPIFAPSPALALSFSDTTSNSTKLPTPPEKNTFLESSEGSKSLKKVQFAPQPTTSTGSFQERMKGMMSTVNMINRALPPKTKKPEKDLQIKSPKYIGLVEHMENFQKDFALSQSQPTGESATEEVSDSIPESKSIQNKPKKSVSFRTKSAPNRGTRRSKL